MDQTVAGFAKKFKLPLEELLQKMTGTDLQGKSADATLSLEDKKLLIKALGGARSVAAAPVARQFAGRGKHRVTVHKIGRQPRGASKPAPAVAAAPAPEAPPPVELPQPVIAEGYASKIGRLMSGTVKKITRDSIILELSDNTEALLPRNKLSGREIFHAGNVVRAVLENIDAEAQGPTLQMSRSSVEMMTELFKIEVPEISEHVIELRAAAREPGQRAKIAVKSNDGRIDPVGACVGMRGARVKAVACELNEEKIDILRWDDDPAELLINAMSPVKIEDMEMDEEKGVIHIVVPEKSLANAIGRGGQNVRLTSTLIGWNVNVISSEDHATRQEHGKKAFMDVLEIPEEKAETLLQQGIVSMEILAYLEENSLGTIEGIPVEEMRQLQEQARDALLVQVISGQDVAVEEEDAEVLKAEAPKKEDAEALKTEALKAEALQEEGAPS